MTGLHLAETMWSNVRCIALRLDLGLEKLARCYTVNPNKHSSV